MPEPEDKTDPCPLKRRDDLATQQLVAMLAIENFSVVVLPGLSGACPSQSRNGMGSQPMPLSERLCCGRDEQVGSRLDDVH